MCDQFVGQITLIKLHRTYKNFFKITNISGTRSLWNWNHSGGSSNNLYGAKYLIVYVWLDNAAVPASRINIITIAWFPGHSFLFCLS